MTEVPVIICQSHSLVSNPRKFEFRNHAKNKKTDYLFVVDAEAHLDSPNTLKELMKQNR